MEPTEKTSRKRKLDDMTQKSDEEALIHYDDETPEVMSVADEGIRQIKRGNDPLNICNAITHRAKKPRSLKVTEKQSEVFIFLKDDCIQVGFRHNKWFLFHFIVNSIVFQNVLPSMEVNFMSETQPTLQHVNDRGFAKILQALLHFNLLGGEAHFNTFHPLYMPTLQTTMRYRSNQAIYSETVLLDKDLLRDLQDELYPTIPDFRSGKIKTLPDPLQSLTPDQDLEVEDYLVLLFQELLSKIREKKKSYSLGVELAEIILNIIEMIVSVGYK